MIESPLIQDMIAKNTAQARHRDILRVVARRFGTVPEEVAAAVRTIYDESKLDELVDTAVTCTTLEAFQQHLAR